jgi:hypothetical protein
MIGPSQLDEKIVTAHAKMVWSIEIDGDDVRIINDHQIPVSLSYATELLSKIKKTAKMDALRGNLSIGKLATWTHDTTAIESIDGNRPCVYFAIHPARQGMVKIGRTKNSLSGRMRSMAWELDRNNVVLPTIIAYAETERYKDFEKALHYKFRDWRITGEWFDGEIVREYLQELAQ